VIVKKKTEKNPRVSNFDVRKLIISNLSKYSTRNRGSIRAHHV